VVVIGLVTLDPHPLLSAAGLVIFASLLGSTLHGFAVRVPSLFWLVCLFGLVFMVTRNFPLDVHRKKELQVHWSITTGTCETGPGNDLAQPLIVPPPPQAH
jgi:hypothetical protein